MPDLSLHDDPVDVLARQIELQQRTIDVLIERVRSLERRVHPSLGYYTQTEAELARPLRGQPVLPLMEDAR